MGRPGIPYEVTVKAIDALLAEGRQVATRAVISKLREDPRNGSPSNQTIMTHIERWEEERAIAARLGQRAISPELTKALLLDMDRRESNLLESSASEIAGVKKLLADAIEELKLSEELAKQLKEEVLQIKQAGETRIRDLEQSLSHAGGKIDLLQTRCAELETDANKARANVALYQQAAQQAEQIAMKLEVQVVALTSQVGTLQAELASSKTEAAVKAEANIRLEAAYAELKELLAQARDRRDQVDADLALTNSRLADAMAKKSLAEKRALLSEQKLRLQPQLGKPGKSKPGTVKP